MAVTFDRAELTAHWAGNGFEGIDDQDTVPLWLRLTERADTDDVADVLVHLLKVLDESKLDWHDEYRDASFGYVAVPLSGREMIGLRSPEWGVAPLEYLDAICDALSARGWTGQLLLHEKAARVWVPYGPEPTITTMLGYGLIPDGGDPHISWPVWRDQPDLTAHLADTALAWIDAASGPLTYISGSDWSNGVDWNPTTEQARALLQVELEYPAGFGIEIGRLQDDPHPEWPGRLRRGTRVGRTAVFEEGHLTLTENDPSRSLEARLADHRAVLGDHNPQVRYGITTGTVGHGRLGPKSVYGERLHLRGQDVSHVPHQCAEHTPGLPDAYFMQLIDSSLLTQTEADLAEWDREDHDGMTLLAAADPGRWFTLIPEPNDPRPDWKRHDADAHRLNVARASLGQLLQQPT